jgi:hypothetical protein
MTSLGVWTCQYRELRPISFGGNNRNVAVVNTEHAPEESSSEGAGYGRGRGRGRGRDGGGTYELVAMPSEDSKV